MSAWGWKRLMFSSYYMDRFGHVAPNKAYQDAVPVAVIPFEDREQVQRLATLFGTQPDCLANFGFTAMQAALREFADPTPPKPEEPTGLGAVVEDDSHRAWVRVGGIYPWLHADADESGDHHTDSCLYAEIAAVKVLSEGVTP